MRTSIVLVVGAIFISISILVVSIILSMMLESWVPFVVVVFIPVLMAASTILYATHVNRQKIYLINGEPVLHEIYNKESKEKRDQYEN